jgi:multicomponent Na+:H+ antiporter subunit D
LLASLSIAGAPLLLGFWSKQALFSPPLTGFPGIAAAQASWVLPLLGVGTAAVYARLCWLPLQGGRDVPAIGAVLLAALLLLAGVVPLWAPEAQGLPGLGKALALLAAGAGVEALRQLAGARLLRGLRLPDLEQLGDLFGGMAVMGAGLVWLLLGWPDPLGMESGVVAWRG